MVGGKLPPLPMPALIPVGEKARRMKEAGEWPPAPAWTPPRPAQPRRRELRDAPVCGVDGYAGPAARAPVHIRI